MKQHYRHALQRWAAHVIRSLCLAAFMVGTGAAQDVVRVEEDWELVLGGPDSNTCAPQVTTTMSPFADIYSTYFTLEINHRSSPSWTPGGISIHRWLGESRMSSYDRADRTVMCTDSETVTWTQSLFVDGTGFLTFKVFNGTSTTWGAFGYSNNVKLRMPWSDNHVNGYTPQVSAEQSGACYAGNRVVSLKIKTIRLTLSDGEVVVDTTERIVHQLLQ
jgi:hypothetical protein